MPPRNDLIAFALMALAFGLMVGLAIAPGWGSAGSTGPLIAVPGEAPAESGATGETAVVADLQAPAGIRTEDSASGETTDLTTTSGSDTTFEATTTSAPATDSPAAPAEEAPEVDPTVSAPEPDEDPAPGLTAAVVGSDDTGFAVADTAGSLLYIHGGQSAAVAPRVGRKIGTDISVVLNGTFEQTGPLTALGTEATTKLNGIVSFVDPESGVIAVSSRGVSVGLDAADAIERAGAAPVLGSWVTTTAVIPSAKSARKAGLEANPPSAEPEAPSDGEATGGLEPEPEPEPIAIPTLTAKTLSVVGEPLKQIELAGPVTWDQATGTLTLPADSFGVINREITVSVPAKLKLKGVEDGLAYAASADLTAGPPALAGLSANYSLESAGDPKQAFGTHAR